MDTAPPQPYPIPAVRALIADDQGRLLLLRRDNTAHGLGGWCLPGGKVDYGQTLEEAVRREVREELAMEVTTVAFFFHQDSLPLVPGGPHFINFYYHCRVTGEPRINGESSVLTWVAPADLAGYDIVFRNDEAVRRHFAGRG